MTIKCKIGAAARASVALCLAVSVMSCDDQHAPSPATGDGMPGPTFVHFAPGRLRVGVGHTGLDRWLRLYRFEEDPVTHQEYLISWREGTSFPVRLVRHRHGDELFVFGTSAAGQAIIERWDIEAMDGAYSTARPTASTPIGVPAPQGLTTTFVAGGQYIPPPGHRERLEVKRESIYVGAALAHLHCLAVDPEGRFLLALLRHPSTLVRLPLPVAGAAPTVICDANSFPALDDMNSLEPMDHAELGRVYVLITADGDYDSMMTLLDAQNDGEFELIEELDAAEWAARGYNGNDVWTHDFVLWR